MGTSSGKGRHRGGSPRHLLRVQRPSGLSAWRAVCPQHAEPGGQVLGAEDGLVCAHQAEEAQETSPGRRRLLLARLASPPPSPPAPLTSPPPAPPPPSTTPHANTAPGRRHRDLTQPLPAGRSGQPRPRSQIRKRGSGSPSPSRAHSQGDRPGLSRTLVGRRAPGVPAPRLDLRGWALTDAGSLSHETLGNRGTAVRGPRSPRPRVPVVETDSRAQRPRLGAGQGRGHGQAAWRVDTTCSHPEG